MSLLRPVAVAAALLCGSLALAQSSSAPTVPVAPIVPAPAASAALPARAEAGALTLDELLRLAQASAEERLALSRIAQRRADNQVLSARGAFDWNMGANFAWRRELEYVASGNSLTTDTVYRWILGTTISFDRLFESGIRLQPGVSIQRANQSSTSLLGARSVLPIVGVEIPLNRPFGESPEKMRVEAAERASLAARLDLDLNRNMHVHQVMRLGWAWLGLQQRMVLQAEVLADTRERVARIARLVERGELAPQTLVRARITLGEREGDAQRLQSELQTLQADLGALLGPGFEGRLAGARLADEFPAAELNPDVQAGLRRAQEARLDLARQRERIEAARIGLRMADRGTQPRMVINATLESIGLSYGRSLGGSRNEAARSDALLDMQAAEIGLREAERAAQRDLEGAARRIREQHAHIERLMAAERDMLPLVQAQARNVERAGAAQLDAYNEVLEARTRVRSQLIEARVALALAIADWRMATGDIGPAPGAAAAAQAGVGLFRSVQ